MGKRLESSLVGPLHRGKRVVPMNALVLTLLVVPSVAAAPPPAKVEAIFQKVAPAGPAVGRSPGRARAVVLIHGLGLHPLSTDRILKPALRPWQQGDSILVKE